MLPTRVISPLRTYQTVPLTSRSRVTRRLTASTVPMASPRSISSPTPYWSSKIMKTPDEEVADQALGTEAQRDADDAGAGDDRADVDPDLAEHHGAERRRRRMPVIDALEQRAHRLGALHPAGWRRPAPGAGALAAPATEREPVDPGREDAGLGPLDEPVDEPVQDPAQHEEQQRCRVATASGVPIRNVRDPGSVLAAGVVQHVVADGSSRYRGRSSSAATWGTSIAVLRVTQNRCTPRRPKCDGVDVRGASTGSRGPVTGGSAGRRGVRYPRSVTPTTTRLARRSCAAAGCRAAAAARRARPRRGAGGLERPRRGRACSSCCW